MPDTLAARTNVNLDLHPPSKSGPAMAFLSAVFLVSAGTLMYEIVLTRLLSAMAWYYLAFVSISTAMFGMTVGALAVQLRPTAFSEEKITRRLLEASAALAISMPLCLLSMLAVPIDLSYAVETLYSFLFFSAIIALPFFFSGVVVCLSLTRTSFPIGRVYGADLLGAAAGCIASVILLSVIDAPSGILAISALLFCGAALYAQYARNLENRKRFAMGAVIMLCLAALNSMTLHGIQPIWAKGAIDQRRHLIAEVWNPISKVRVLAPTTTKPQMWGGSPRMPDTFQVEQSLVDIDNDAETPVMRFQGDLSQFQFLNYDVSSLAAQLRKGGTAAVIGVGGGRDVLTCAVNGFTRIVGIEINSRMVDLMTKRLAGFSGFSRIPGFELHNDEGRSYLTRSGEKFDVIQASLVDTWAATSAGAMTLAENALYTVDGWRVFYEHLKPGGVITFTRWDYPGHEVETNRLFSVAWATLLSEGVSRPGDQLALIKAPMVATLLASNLPFSPKDITTLRSMATDMDFQVLFLPGERPASRELKTIASARTVAALAGLRSLNIYDYSPVFDASPYFFNSVHLRGALRAMENEGTENANLRALLFVFCFALVALLLVLVTILLPFWAWARSSGAARRLPIGAIPYFIAIGLGFMLIEMAMIQQLSIFLGHPIYSLVVVLAGLILSAGVGSLASDQLRIHSFLSSRLPPFAVMAAVWLYTLAVLPVSHRYVADPLWQRVGLSLALVVPCGFLMGLCFPIGLRWMKSLGQGESLPWMWALNGAAGTLGTFLAVFISMESTIAACALTGAACYFIAGMALLAPLRMRSATSE